MSEPPKLAICAIAKNEALYVEEWMAFHFLQGVIEILIFDNESTDGTREILTRIARHVSVSVLDWPILSITRGGYRIYRSAWKLIAR
jgi:glycosyltransferase involved in cell wall biosynthesis